MLITIVCLPNVHCSLPMSTGLCCTNIHCSSPVVVFHCCSSLLSAVSLSSCCNTSRETDDPQFRQCLLFDTTLFCQCLNSPMPDFWHSPVFANTQFHTSLDFYQCLIIAGTHVLPIFDSIWIPSGSQMLRIPFSWVNDFGFLVSIRLFMSISIEVR